MQEYIFFTIIQGGPINDPAGIYILQKFKGGPINPQYAQFIHLGNDGTGLPRRSSYARTIILG